MSICSVSEFSFGGTLRTRVLVEMSLLTNSPPPLICFRQLVLRPRGPKALRNTLRLYLHQVRDETYQRRRPLPTKELSKTGAIPLYRVHTGTARMRAWLRENHQ